MEEFVQVAARLARAAKQAYARKWAFLGLFALMFAASILVLRWLDLLPNPSRVPEVAVAPSPLVVSGAAASRVALGAEVPVKIEVPAIGLSASIANPDTVDVAALDALLLKGAVRYPTSARLGEAGNVVLFGHSCYLPVVLNPAYKTFNGIQKLRAGDAITVYSVDAAYTYAVRSVAKESADDAAIPLSVAGRVLTLSTCDSFGAKTDRFVVVADFVESHPIPG